MNPHFNSLEKNYLFADINDRIMAATQEKKITLPVIICMS